MTDDEYETQKARIAPLIERWVKPLGLGWWKIDIAYRRERFDPKGDGERFSEGEVLGKCWANWRYGEACITLSMPAVADLKDDELETAFLHELMHVFLNETREAGDDWLCHEERVASTLTKAFLWLRDHLTGGDDAVSQQV